MTKLTRSRFTKADHGAPRKSKYPVAVAALTALLLLVAVTSAFAIRLRAGDILITADGGFAPKALPEHENAPITIHGGGKISTASGELPPILQQINFEFDRHGALDTTGLPKCSVAKLKATTTPQARKLCPGAIVGTGQGTAVVKFPEQAPIPASSPITIFNGPVVGGSPSVLAHAHLTVPAPTTFIVPVVIKKIHNGVYGYRTEATIPKIANGYGIPISGSLRIGRKWTYRGVKHSYLSARCETGHLQARGEFGFNDGTRLEGTFLRPCTVRG